MSNPAFDARMAATALRLITKFGAPVVFSTKTAGAYDPATSAATVGTVTQTVQALRGQYSRSDMASGMIRQGDVKLMCAASGITAPSVDDTCVLSGKLFTAKDVQEIAPAGVPYYYEVLVRE